MATRTFPAEEHAQSDEEQDGVDQEDRRRSGDGDEEPAYRRTYGPGYVDVNAGQGDGLGQLAARDEIWLYRLPGRQHRGESRPECEGERQQEPGCHRTEQGRKP